MSRLILAEYLNTLILRQATCYPHMWERTLIDVLDTMLLIDLDGV